MLDFSFFSPTPSPSGALLVLVSNLCWTSWASPNEGTVIVYSVGILFRSLLHRETWPASCRCSSYHICAHSSQSDLLKHICSLCKMSLVLLLHCDQYLKSSLWTSRHYTYWPLSVSVSYVPDTTLNIRIIWNTSICPPRVESLVGFLRDRSKTFSNLPICEYRYSIKHSPINYSFCTGQDTHKLCFLISLVPRWTCLFHMSDLLPSSTFYFLF